MNQVFYVSPAHISATDIDGLPTKPMAPGGFFDTLPIEILGEIFGHCLPSKAKRLPTPSMQEAPLLLCMICVRWRQVAMSMPVLWSSFSAQPSRAADAPPYVPLMKSLLGLSRPCPLSFDIYAANPEQQNLVKRSFPLFLSEVHRWHDVTLNFNDVLLEQFLAARLGCASSLESLCFNTFDCTSEQAHRIPTTLKNFPRLRRLKIGRTSAVPLLELPWSQLTDIQINTPVPLDECINALNECSSVMDCSFFRIIPPRGAIKPHNIVLPALTRLELCSTCDVGEILAHLTCPAMTYLSVNHRIWDSARDPKAFGEFCVRSSCKLKTFRLLDERATEPDIIQYISVPALQSLESLELRGLGASFDTLTMFKYDAGGSAAVFMPFLETLQLDAVGVPDNLFGDAVASRFNYTASETVSTKRPAPLKSVYAWFRLRDCETSPEDIDALRSEHVFDGKRFEEFKRKGLHVVMRFGD